MEVLISENNPQRGVDFLNRLEQTYIEFGLAEKTRVAENTIRYIDNQLESFTGILANSEDKITNYRTDNKAVNLNQESGFAMQKQQTLESDKALLEYRLEYLRNLRQNMKDSRQLKQIMVPSVFGISDQTLNNLVAFCGGFSFHA